MPAYWLSTSRMSADAMLLSSSKFPANSCSSSRSTAPGQSKDDCMSSLRACSPPSPTLGEARRRRCPPPPAPTSTVEYMIAERAPSASRTWAARLMVPVGRRMSRLGDSFQSNTTSLSSPSTWYPKRYSRPPSVSAQLSHEMRRRSNTGWPALTHGAPSFPSTRHVWHGTPTGGELTTTTCSALPTTVSSAPTTVQDEVIR
mmetsp:Transcript_56971/g.134481  ORF Transcript_56971/g.134481 Transcript_56971/m.134481 type:complete len:201 (+) Transcript_56971:1525-2127(+)